MVDDKFQIIKRLMRNYSVAVVATAILLFILLALIVARYNALSSIQDLSKLNPLITSEHNELIAAKDSSGVIEVAKVDNTKINDKKEAPKTTTNKSTETKSGSKSSGGGSSGDGSSGGSSGGGSGDGGSGQQEPFTANIFNVRYYSPGIGTKKKCELTHAFDAKISGVNSPGTVTYRWQHSMGDQDPEEHINFQEGDSLKTTPMHSWKIKSETGSYWVKFIILAPDYKEQSYEFVHQCLLPVGR